MKKTVDAFLSGASISPVSALSYRRDLESLGEYFAWDLKKVQKGQLNSFFEALSQRISPSSFSRLVSVVRSYFAYLLKEGKISENPMEGISTKDFTGKEAINLTEEECERLITYSAPGFRGIRDQVMLCVLAETGIRVSELISLDRKDISPGAIHCGKDRHRRVLPLSAPLSRKIADYMVLSALYLPPISEAQPLFITAKGDRITRQGFWKNLKDRAIYCGIDKAISPHSLRRHLAVKLLEEGRDREEIRQQLGNVDTASLRGYQQKNKE